jgi:hypothetical protein
MDVNVMDEDNLKECQLRSTISFGGVDEKMVMDGLCSRVNK